MVALTLRLDGPTVSTQDGLAILQLFLKSMGMFGPGFAAVYPKWGGSGEISQVACRAQAVGGGVYMLGMGIKATAPEEKGTTEFELFNGIKVKTRLLVQGGDQSVKTGAPWAHRLIAIVSSPLSSLFEAAVEGSPTPAVAIVTFSDGSVPTSDGTTYPHPVFALVNSSETGECPAGQCKWHVYSCARVFQKPVFRDDYISQITYPRCLSVMMDQNCHFFRLIKKKTSSSHAPPSPHLDPRGMTPNREA